jgi:hypothetical protein
MSTTTLNAAALREEVTESGIKRNHGVDEAQLYAVSTLPEDVDANVRARLFLKACFAADAGRARALFEGFPATYRESHASFRSAVVTDAALETPGESSDSGTDEASGTDASTIAPTSTSACAGSLTPTMPVSTLLFLGACLTARAGEQSMLRWLCRAGAQDVRCFEDEALFARAQATDMDAMCAALPCPHPQLLLAEAERLRALDVAEAGANEGDGGAEQAPQDPPVNSDDSAGAQSTSKRQRRRRNARSRYGHFRNDTGAAAGASSKSDPRRALQAQLGRTLALDDAGYEEELQRRALASLKDVQGPEPVLASPHGLHERNEHILRSLLQSQGLAATVQALPVNILCVAALHGKAECFAYLRNNYEYTDRVLQCACACACVGGAAQLVQSLMADVKGKLTETFAKSAFMHACACDQAGIMNLLFAASDVRDNPVTGEALITAAHHNARKALEWLTLVALKTEAPYPRRVMQHAFVTAAGQGATDVLAYLLQTVRSGVPVFVADAGDIMAAFLEAGGASPAPCLRAVDMLRPQVTFMSTRDYFVPAVTLRVATVVEAVIACMRAQVWPIAMWMLRVWILPLRMQGEGHAVADSLGNVRIAMATLQRYVEDSMLRIAGACPGTGDDLRLLLWLKQVATLCWRMQGADGKRACGAVQRTSTVAPGVFVDASSGMAWPQLGVTLLRTLLTTSQYHCPLTFFQSIAHAFRVEPMRRRGLPQLLQDAALRNRLDVVQWIESVNTTATPASSAGVSAGCGSVMPAQAAQCAGRMSGAWRRAIKLLRLFKTHGTTSGFAVTKQFNSPPELVNKLPLLRLLHAHGVPMHSANSKLVTLFARGALKAQKMHPDWEVVKWLASLPEIDVTRRRNAALYYASRAEHDDVVRALLARGASHTWRDASKETAEACAQFIQQVKDALHDEATEHAVLAAMDAGDASAKEQH